MENEATPQQLPKRIPQTVLAGTPETRPLITRVNVLAEGGTDGTYDYIPLAEVASALAEARKRYLTTGKLDQVDLDMVDAAASFVSLSASLSPETTIGLPVVRMCDDVGRDNWRAPKDRVGCGHPMSEHFDEEGCTHLLDGQKHRICGCPGRVTSLADKLAARVPQYLGTAEERFPSRYGRSLADLLAGLLRENGNGRTLNREAVRVLWRRRYPQQAAASLERSTLRTGKANDTSGSRSRTSLNQAYRALEQAGIINRLTVDSVSVLDVRRLVEIARQYKGFDARSSTPGTPTSFPVRTRCHQARTGRSRKNEPKESTRWAP